MTNGGPCCGVWIKGRLLVNNRPRYMPIRNTTDISTTLEISNHSGWRAYPRLRHCRHNSALSYANTVLVKNCTKRTVYLSPTTENRTMNKPTQMQMYYRAERQAAEVNLTFLELVADGLTRGELARNIERRPALWSRFANWLPKLPEQA